MRHFIIFLLVLFTTSLSAQEKLKKKNGQVTVKNNNGIVIEQGLVKKHLREGLWTKYYDTGKREEEITYLHGVKNGVYRYYTKEGALKKEGFHTNDLPTGEWKFYDFAQRLASVMHYDTGGKLLSTDQYSSGKLKERQIQGSGGYLYVETFNPDGTVFKRYTTLNGKMEGVYYEYSQNRKKNDTTGDTLPRKITHYHNGVREGSDMEWQIKGGRRVLRSEAWYKNDTKDSIYRWNYAREHMLIETYYKNGKKEGLEIIYTDSIITSRSWYKMGNADSTYEYYKDGKVKVNTTRQYIRRYYPDGKLQENATLGKSGTIEGPVTTYYPNGKKKYEVNYSMMSVNGEWKAWNDKGVLVIHAWAEQFQDTLEYVYNSKGKRLKETDPEYAEQFRFYKAGMMISVVPTSELFNGDQNQEGGYEEVSDEVPPAIAQESVVEEQVFVFAEVMPEFPGGEAAFQEYLRKNLKYPQIERDAGKDGTVYITFTVKVDGKIADVKVAKPVPGAPGFSKEAIRLFTEMPNWIPGKMNGRPINITMTKPVRFKLD
jgi:TonB family protein